MSDFIPNCYITLDDNRVYGVIMNELSEHVIVRFRASTIGQGTCNQFVDVPVPRANVTWLEKSIDDDIQWHET
jgi:hypothetical protein